MTGTIPQQGRWTMARTSARRAASGSIRSSSTRPAGAPQVSLDQAIPSRAFQFHEFTQEPAAGRSPLTIGMAWGQEIAVRREAIFRLMEAIEVVEPTHSVLVRAAQPLPTALGTLDAIHLATALLWREQTGASLVMATHDEALGTAAKACGLRVIGL